MNFIAKTNATMPKRKLARGFIAGFNGFPTAWILRDAEKILSILKILRIVRILRIP